MTTELILKPRTLTLEDLPFLQNLGRIENDKFVLERSPKGYKLKTPTAVPLEKILTVGQSGLVEFMISSLIRERPRLISFAFENQTVIALARYFCRYRSGSLQGFYAYTDTISRYSSWVGYRPDEIIADVKGENGLPDPVRIQKHVRLLEDYVATLQDRNLSPGRVHSCAKHVKALYKANGILLNLPYSLSRTVTFKDRSPKGDELQRLLDIADLREKVIVSMMTLGGFREETLTKLRYGHVRVDLEAGRIPLHVHVEVAITKGKYADYDTFLGQEAVEFLRLYLDTRRQGSPEGKIPPETIHDNSPLIRDSQSRTPKPIGPKQVRKLIHQLYLRGGLIHTRNGRMYDLRVHSLRKFFKTQMEAAGVNSDYVEYMMGHKISTYHDVQAVGLERLRNAYASAGLTIRPRSGINKIEMVKEFARGLGLNPEEILVKQAFSEPDTKYVDPQERERADIRALMLAIKADLKVSP